MLIFRSIVCLFFVTHSYAQDFEAKFYPERVLAPASMASNNFIIRAESETDKFRFDHVDKISFLVDGEMRPLLEVAGRVCLSIEGDAWCDMLQRIFSLPADDFQMELKTVDKKELLEVFLRKDEKFISIGHSVLTSEQLQSVQVKEDIILFFDKSKNVPAVLWLQPNQDSLHSRSRKARFDVLYKNLI